MLLKTENTESGEECLFESSNIDKTLYTPEQEQLIIWFKKGGAYIYTPVNQMIYEQFKRAESQGKYFLANIKKNKEILCEKVFENSKNKNQIL